MWKLVLIAAALWLVSEVTPKLDVRNAIAADQCQRDGWSLSACKR